MLNVILSYSGAAYLLFSSYVSLVFTDIGYALVEQTGENVFAFVFIAIAIAAQIPYLLAYIFTKKNNVAWMIVALSLFSVDTIILLVDIPAYIKAGDYMIFLDAIIHALAIYELAIGLKATIARKKELEQAADALVEETTDIDNDTPKLPLRTITLTRKKAFVGMAIKINVYVNDELVATLKNGQTAEIQAPGESFELGAALANGFGADSIVVPAAGEGSLPVCSNYVMYMKAGFSAASLIIEPAE